MNMFIRKYRGDNFWSCMCSAVVLAWNKNQRFYVNVSANERYFLPTKSNNQCLYHKVWYQLSTCYFFVFQTTMQTVVF